MVYFLDRFRSHLDVLLQEGWRTATGCQLCLPEQLGPRTVVLTFDDGFANTLPACDALSQYGMSATWFVVSGDIGRRARWIGVNAPGGELLSAGQLRAMVDAGMEVGGHTRTHVRLSGLDQSILDREVGGCRKDLEDVLGSPVKSFAYPYGFLDEASVQAVRRADFEIAFSTRTGWFGSDPDLLRVRRVAVFGSDTASTFARNLAFANNDVSWARSVHYVFIQARDRLRRG